MYFKIYECIQYLGVNSYIHIVLHIEITEKEERNNVLLIPDRALSRNW